MLLVLMNACKDDVTDENSFQLNYIELSAHDSLPPFIIPEDNKPCTERIDLGRRLYYDKSLSTGGPLEGQACASCHEQNKSFSSKNGVGVLPHHNLAWSSSFLWNGAVEGQLEDIMVFELRDFFEVDFNNLAQNQAYREGFRKAFEDGQINLENSAYALAQFFRSLISDKSKFDEFLQGNVLLTPQEMRGYAIFNSERGDCFHCHTLPLMTDNDFHNIGLIDKFSGHLGRYEVTKRSSDVGAFKTPSLRNVEFTGPYMHDDRFETLEEVVEHYNSGVKNSPALDPIMTKSGKETGLRLTEQEKEDLIAFLKTLSDPSFVENPAHGSPF